MTYLIFINQRLGRLCMWEWCQCAIYEQKPYNFTTNTQKASRFLLSACTKITTSHFSSCQESPAAYMQVKTFTTLHHSFHIHFGHIRMLTNILTNGPSGLNCDYIEEFYMSTYLPVYIHIYIYIYIYIYPSIYLSTYLSICMYMWLHVHTYR